GSVDASFQLGTGPNGWPEALVIQPDGKILFGGTLTTYNGTSRPGMARINGTPRARIKIMLDGPYGAGQMNDALRTLPSFPLTEPFTAQGYARPVFTPGATIAPVVLTRTGNDAIVDWVIVEMRPSATPSVVSASRAVLLQRDGDIVDLDGVSTVGFTGLAAGNYCVAVISRNHLPVMLSPSSPVAYGNAVATVDFTLPTTPLYNASATKNVGGVMLAKSGDVTFNSAIAYVGAGNDRDPILARIGGATPTATVTGYYREDVNMDGVVRYVGAANDRDPILINIGGSTPTATVVATLP
ncbi:MAG TPA: delta-60 repeat domain-containing protein, partial [Flavobacteriales bacterium]|nr:delta-60 repeat domain-containing protein [Flavobacteriales bacterium]